MLESSLPESGFPGVVVPVSGNTFKINNIHRKELKYHIFETDNLPQNTILVTQYLPLLQE